MSRIEDADEISEVLQELRRATESGFYAPVTNVVYEQKESINDIFIISLDYPSEGDTGEYRVSVPKYWEDGRELVEFLRNMDVQTDDIGTLTDRAVPVARVDGSWSIDQERLSNGDYLDDDDQYVKQDDDDDDERETRRGPPGGLPPGQK